VMNESGAPLEADFCNVQYPYSLSMTTGTTAVTTYGQIWESGVTSASGADVNIVAQMGWGLPGNNPQYESWNWLNSIYNIPSGDNDEYMNNASLSFGTPGSYRYVYRFSLDQGVTWTVCGNGGAGSNSGLDFTFASEAVLTVN